MAQPEPIGSINVGTRAGSKRGDNFVVTAGRETRENLQNIYRAEVAGVPHVTVRSVNANKKSDEISLVLSSIAALMGHLVGKRERQTAVRFSVLKFGSPVNGVYMPEH